MIRPCPPQNKPSQFIFIFNATLTGFLFSTSISAFPRPPEFVSSVLISCIIHLSCAFTMAEAALKLFEKRLANKSPRTRFPTSIESAFRKAIKAPSHHTDRIFLSISFHAWLAYFLTRSAANSQRHYEGQKKDYDILADFEKLLSTKKEDVARKLDEVNIHPTVLEHIKEWGEKLQSTSLLCSERRILTGC
jgi:hypothetical protein